MRSALKEKYIYIYRNMNIKEFLDKNNIRYVPIMLTLKDGKKTLEECTWYGDRKPSMDKVFEDNDYYQTRSLLDNGTISDSDYDFIAIDTSKFRKLT